MSDRPKRADTRPATTMYLDMHPLALIRGEQRYHAARVYTHVLASGPRCSLGAVSAIIDARVPVAFAVPGLGQQPCAVWISDARLTLTSAGLLFRGRLEHIPEAEHEGP